MRGLTSRIAVFFSILWMGINVQSHGHANLSMAMQVYDEYEAGEYRKCSMYGEDTVIDNLYDAFIVAVSSLANYHLAYAEHNYKEQSNTFVVGLTKFEIEAGNVSNYLNSICDYLEDTPELKSEQSAIIIHDIFLRCLELCKSKLYYRLMNLFHERYALHIDTSSPRQRLTILFYETKYHADRRHFQQIVNIWVPRFEETVLSILVKERSDFSKISSTYSRMSKFISKLAVENEGRYGLSDLSCNLILRGREYEFSSGQTNAYGKLIQWRDIQDYLPTNSLACIYFEYSYALDSMNCAWIFSKESTTLGIANGGHSYWSEQQSASTLLAHHPNADSYYVMGTDNMMLTDYSSDSRVRCVYRFSSMFGDITNSYYTSGERVIALCNINYSYSDNIDKTAKEKGAMEHLLKLGSGKEEVDILTKLFNDSIDTYQEGAVTKSLFISLTSDYKILHISTHGYFDIEKLEKLNTEYPAGGEDGTNILKSCIFYLSGYNDDNSCFITADEIQKLDFTGLHLVFLSACYSGSGRLIDSGAYSFAYAFKKAGVSKIIAILDPIDDELAAEFAKHFYEKVSNSVSYHNAFYETKCKLCPNERIIFIE